MSASTSARPSFWAELLSVSGRTNRGRYWLTVPVVLLTAWVLGMVTLMALSLHPDQLAAGEGAGVLWLVIAICCVPVFLAGIRRLHDRNKSGHWAWLFMLAPAVLNILSEILVLQGLSAGYTFALAGITLWVWGFIEIACLRGTVGPNRFGPDPLEEASPGVV